MSTSNSDAVLDRVLTRIVSAGAQKAPSGRSPARGISSVLQRDGGSARGLLGVDKRRVAKLYANYRLTNPAFGSSSARDSSLAGTNTVVPQIVFSKGILRQPTSVVLQPPSAAVAATTAVAANSSQGAAVAQTASGKTSAVILRQQAQRHPSPQPHLRARCSSPPLNLASAAASARRQSSPDDSHVVEGIGGGFNDGRGASPRSGRMFAKCAGGTVRSPRALSAGRATAGAMSSRSRSSPRDRAYGSGDSGSGLVAGGLLSGVFGGGEAGGGAFTAAGDGATAAQPRRSSNTITRAAALRALKQQRSTTPDIVAELRAVGPAKAAVPPEVPARAGPQSASSYSAGFAKAPANAGTTVQQQQQPTGGADDARAAGGPAPANADALASIVAAAQGQPYTSGLSATAPGPGGRYGASNVAPGGGVQPRAPRTSETSPHPPTHPPSQCQQRSAPAAPEGPCRRAPDSQHQHTQPVQFQPSRLDQQPEACFLSARPGLEAVDSVGVHPWGQCTLLTVSAAPMQAASLTLPSSPCNDNGQVWPLDQEPSFRSPSPQRTNDPASSRGALAVTSATAGLEANGGAPTVGAAAAAAVAHRQERAMRQHVQRQTSPSPGRRRAASPGAQVRRSTSPPPQQQRQSQDQRTAFLEGSWQGDVAMAAQSRIRRLEEQVISLSAQVAELQASHADLEFQLEEEQQNQQQQARAVAARGHVGGAGAEKPGLQHGPSQPQQPRQSLLRQKQQEREREQQLQGQMRQLQEEVHEMQERLQAREAEMQEQITRAKAVNDTLAKQNRALYGTLEETLSAAEHAAQELKQLRATHAQLQEAHDAAVKEASQLKEDLDLRERALSAVQAEFSALRRRHEEVTAAADVARRDSALRDGRLRREMEAATVEAAALAAQLTKLQREHQQLHGRKADKDRQLATLAKRADAQQEQLAAAERLAQEQAALVRELESRATLLRNRNAALDRAVAAEKEARQAAQEQVRQMEEEIALLVSIVRQSDPSLETLGRYKRDPAAAAAMAAAAAAAAAAALLQASPSPTRGGPRSEDEDVPEEASEVGGGGAAGRDAFASAANIGPPPPPPVSGGRRLREPHGHSVVTITATAGDAVPVVQPRGARATAHPPLSAMPGAAPLSVRAPPPGMLPPPQLHRRTEWDDAEVTAALPAALAAGGGSHTSPRAGSPGASPRGKPELEGAPGAGAARRRTAGSRDNSPLAMPYPAKHNMTGGVFLDIGGGRGCSPRVGAAHASPLAAGKAGAGGAAGHSGGTAGSPRWVDDARLAAGRAGYLASGRVARTPPGRRALSAGGRARRGSEPAGGQNLAATWGCGDGLVEAIGVGKAAGGRGSSGRPEPRRSVTPRGTSTVRRGQDGQGLLAAPAMAAAVAFLVRPSNKAAVITAAPERGHSRGVGAGVAGGHATAAVPTAAATLKTAPHDDRPTAPQALAPLETATLDLTQGDRVLWAAPRRPNRPAAASSASGASGSRSSQQEPSYAAMHAAQRALATAVLTARDSVAGGRSRSCGAVDWVRSRAGQHRAVARRARTPEPRTAAAWHKLSEDGAVTAAAAGNSSSGGRKRSPTPLSEISSTGRGSYKLGPPSPGGGLPPEARCSQAAAELAALLQQRPPSPAAWTTAAGSGGGREAAVRHSIHFPTEALQVAGGEGLDGAVCPDAQVMEEQDLQQWIQALGPLAERAGLVDEGRVAAVEEIAGPSKRSRVGGGCGRGSNAASRDGAVWQRSNLDDDSKIEMASPIKAHAAPGRRPPGGLVVVPSAPVEGITDCVAGGWDAHVGDHADTDNNNESGDDDEGKGDDGSGGCAEACLDDQGVLECAAVSFADAAAGGAGSNFCSPCQKGGRDPARGGDLDRPSSTIRASYAFDSPLHQLQRQSLHHYQHDHQQQQQHPAVDGEGLIQDLTGVAVAHAEATGDGDAGNTDMGAVLRNLQQRQAYLLQQLADDGGTDGPTPSAVKGRGAVLPPSRLDPSLLGLAGPAGSPGVGSFTFANIAHGAPFSSPARTGACGGAVTADYADQPDEGGSIGGGGLGGGDLPRSGQVARGRTVSFADDLLAERRQRSGIRPTPQTLQLPVPSLQQQQSAQAPPRSPHRPSVAAAAAAAAAAGAGVGGPLTALLDQLESSSGSWTGEGSTGGAAAAGAVAPPASPPPPSSQRHRPELQHQVMTHFNLAAALQAVADQDRQPQQPEQPWQQHQQHQQLLMQSQRLDSEFDDDRDYSDTEEETEDSDEERRGLSPVEEDEEILDEEGADGEGEEVEELLSGEESSREAASWLDPGEVPVPPPRVRVALPDSGKAAPVQQQADAASASEDDGNGAAMPASPQPRDERSAGGSELFPDEVYGSEVFHDGDAGSRLGVSLYDNIAYDSRASEAGSGRTDYQPGLGNAVGDGAAAGGVVGVPGHGSRSWRPPSNLGPAVRVPTSLAGDGGGAASGAGNSGGRDMDGPQSEVLNMEPFSPPRSASVSRPVPGELRSGSFSHSELRNSAAASAPFSAATTIASGSGVWSTTSQPTSLEAVYRAHRGGHTDQPSASSLEQSLWEPLEPADGGSGASAFVSAAAEAAEAARDADGAQSGATPDAFEPGAHAAGDLVDDGGGAHPDPGVPTRLVEADLTAGPVTPHQAAAVAQLLGGPGGGGPPSSSSLSLPMSTSSLGGAVAATMSCGGTFPRSAPGAPGLGSWWAGRPEPTTLLDRQLQHQQQPPGLLTTSLSASRASLGPIAYGVSVSSGGVSGSSSGGISGSSSSCGGGAGSSSHEWLQRQRPASPSVKPLSLAEVLRRPAGSNGR